MPSKKKAESQSKDLAHYDLNGLSVNSITLSQDGDIEVEFDLAHTQTSVHWSSNLTGTRTFDVYEDSELEQICGQLFQLLRSRVLSPDPEREEIHCDSCKSSACCRNYNVLLRESDIERLCEGLDVNRQELVKRFTDKAVDWCGDFERQLACDEDEEGDEKCVFLQQDNEGRWRCSVYEHRPQICRDFDMRACNDFVPIEDLVP